MTKYKGRAAHLLPFLGSYRPPASKIRLVANQHDNLVDEVRQFSVEKNRSFISILSSSNGFREAIDRENTLGC